MRRLILIPAAVLAVALAGVTGSASGNVTQDVNLACSDGTNLDATLDLAAVTELADAVTAINLYPAGDPALTCDLTQSAITNAPSLMGIPLAASSTSASSNPNKDYAVGGGRSGCQSFSLNFHVENNAATTPPQPKVGGSFNTTVPESCFGLTSHLVTKVDCVLVGGFGPGSAQATAVVIKATGFFAALEGTEIRWDVLDSGLLGPAPKGDMLQGYPGATQCDFSSYAPTEQVDQGNISVNNSP